MSQVLPVSSSHPSARLFHLSAHKLTSAMEDSSVPEQPRTAVAGSRPHRWQTATDDKYPNSPALRGDNSAVCSTLHLKVPWGVSPATHKVAGLITCSLLSPRFALWFPYSSFLHFPNKLLSSNLCLRSYSRATLRYHIRSLHSPFCLPQIFYPSKSQLKRQLFNSPSCHISLLCVLTDLSYLKLSCLYNELKNYVSPRGLALQGKCLEYLGSQHRGRVWHIVGTLEIFVDLVNE